MPDKKAEDMIIGVAYERPKELVKKYAKQGINVLFVGETGSGKELFADLFMAECPRKGKRRTVNCAAIADQFLHSDIFGHVKGAYTGATEKRDGLLETCKNGILFLDELGKASQEFQAAILRVAEGNSYKKLGSDKEEIPDVLIIATASSLSRINEDLKYRFNIFPIPQLQHFDIPEIAKHLLGKPLKREVLDMLMKEQFPGNVRQLISRCNGLQVERGKEIFTKRISNTKVGIGSIDYNRFRMEYLAWQSHIQPTLDDYNFSMRYKYQDISQSNKKDYASNKDIDLLMEFLIGFDERPDALTKGGYAELLRNILQKGNLPLFLKEIEKKKAEYGHASVPTPDAKPDISYLLDKMPPQEATQEFKKTYYNFHLERHKQNRKNTATALGINQNTLKSSLRILFPPLSSKK